MIKNQLTVQEAAQSVWLVSHFTIELSTYAEYLRDFWADETTSPRGVVPRIHYRENGQGQFEIWSWGTGGNHPFYLHECYDNEEDAELSVLRAFEINMQSSTGVNGMPSRWYTREEALVELAELHEKPMERLRPRL